MNPRQIRYKQELEQYHKRVKQINQAGDFRLALAQDLNKVLEQISSLQDRYDEDVSKMLMLERLQDSRHPDDCETPYTHLEDIADEVSHIQTQLRNDVYGEQPRIESSIDRKGIKRLLLREHFDQFKEERKLSEEVEISVGVRRICDLEDEDGIIHKNGTTAMPNREYW